MGAQQITNVNRNRYSRALEQAPELLATLNDQSQADLELRSEAGLARTLLEQVLAQLGEMHGKSGVMNPLVLQNVSALLGQVQSIVRDAAAIEAKRNDQRINATHMLTLLVALRNDLKRRLNMAFGDAAGEIVEACFAGAKWTGGLREDDVAEALLEPAAFELKLRVVDREGDTIKESAKARGLSSPEILALAGAASDVERNDPLAVPGTQDGA